jgi:hypothetical protein
VHLLKDGCPTAANGLPDAVGQRGHEPGDGRFPTTQWETWTQPPIVLDDRDSTEYIASSLSERHVYAQLCGCM